ncbi:MAG: hypothetical protein NUV80_04215 [Candidatus Berkelbacteria bacterium]|nr:hypothetical protein [Candidatus Berkelbacteria bacterium]
MDEESLGRALKRDPKLASLQTALHRLGSKVQPVDSDLLEPIGVFRQEGVTTFDPAAFFGEGNTKVKFSYIDDDLTKLPTETNIPAVDLRASRFRHDTHFEPVLLELGDQKDVKVALAHVAAMLTAQGQGQPGRLLNDGKATLIPLGNYRYLYACWDDGWYLGASPIADPRSWRQGRQVVSC